MTLKQFKEEFRFMCCDLWGDALDAWFECAGNMYKRDLPIPEHWQYRPGLGDPCEPDSYFYSLFRNSTNDELIQIGNFLTRYCQLLKHCRKDY